MSKKSYKIECFYFLTICFVTPSLSNFCQKIISFQLFEMGLTSLPTIWTMSSNIFCFFLEYLPLSRALVRQELIYFLLGMRYPNHVLNNFSFKSFSSYFTSNLTSEQSGLLLLIVLTCVRCSSLPPR